MKFTIIILSILISLSNSFAQEVQDTAKISDFGNFIDKAPQSKAFNMLYAGAPLVIGGLIVQSEDDHFRGLRNDYIPTFKSQLDNYSQFAPVALMVGMKAAGVKSRSSWGRMIVSDAFSAGLMALTVNVLKNVIDETRPDGSSNNSFPSGHTATAFMCATMFDKEYGSRYPILSVGAYAVATGTGLFRMANNRHWLSDIMVGAGVGILSTQIGYYLADLIFKDKGINREDNTYKPNRFRKPSFIGTYLGFNVPLSYYDINESVSLQTSSGTTAGLEGAYFFNPYVGVGGRFTVSNSNITVQVNNSETEYAQDETWKYYKGSAGAYFSYPISRYFQIGAKALLSYVSYNELDLNKYDLYKVKGNKGLGAGCGISSSFTPYEKMGFRLFADYDVTPPCSSVAKKYVHSLNIGGTCFVNF